MKIHGLAVLSVPQRRQLRRDFLTGHYAIAELARNYHCSWLTANRWAHRDDPCDHSCAPKHHWTVVTPQYREAVLACRRDNPHWGPIRIAWVLKPDFTQANRGTVLRILQQADLTRPPRKAKRTHKPIPVGRHRVQADIQTLPAVKGGHGRQYKITFIHLATRAKHSEICPDRRTETVLKVFRHALDKLPPFG